MLHRASRELWGFAASLVKTGTICIPLWVSGSVFSYAILSLDADGFHARELNTPLGTQWDLGDLCDRSAPLYCCLLNLACLGLLGSWLFSQTLSICQGLPGFPLPVVWLGNSQGNKLQ